MSALPYPDIFGGCPCWTCWDKRTPTPAEGFRFGIMNLCPTCGNKRCPAASDHEKWVCSGSNEPGQKAQPIRDGGSDGH